MFITLNTSLKRISLYNFFKEGINYIQFCRYDGLKTPSTSNIVCLKTVLKEYHSCSNILC